MSSLDQQLREILEDWYPGTMYEDVIPKIKTAFIDDGWQEPDENRKILLTVPKAIKEGKFEYIGMNTIRIRNVENEIELSWKASGIE